MSAYFCWSVVDLSALPGPQWDLAFSALHRATAVYGSVKQVKQIARDIWLVYDVRGFR